MQYPLITVTSSSPFIFYPPTPGEIGVLEVHVADGGADVWYGDVPEKAVSISGVSSFKAGSAVIGVAGTADTGSPGWNDIKPGYVFSCTDDGSDDGLYVVEVDPELPRKWVRLNDDLSINADSYAIVFTPPDVTEDTGQLIAAGRSKSFAADKFNRFLNRPMKFMVPSGTATLHVRYIPC